MDMEHAALTLVDEKLISKHNAVPLFKRGKRLFVAISNATNMQALDEFKFNTGLSTEPVLVQEDQLEKFIDKAISAMDTGMDTMLDDDLENLDIEAVGMSNVRYRGDAKVSISEAGMSSVERD